MYAVPEGIGTDKAGLPILLLVVVGHLGAGRRLTRALQGGLGGAELGKYRNLTTLKKTFSLISSDWLLHTPYTITLDTTLNIYLVEVLKKVSLC